MLATVDAERFVHKIGPTYDNTCTSDGQPDLRAYVEGVDRAADRLPLVAAETVHDHERRPRLAQLISSIVSIVFLMDTIEADTPRR